MRVISGELKGRKLEKLEGMDIRPTSDRVKESLFNMFGIRIFDSSFLDLFAGTGAIGIEAYSRGAARIVFVDADARSIQVLKGNLQKLNILDKTEIYNIDYMNAINKLSADGRSFDIIFMDPPYLRGYEKNALKEVSDKNLLSTDGIIVVEHDLLDDMPERAGRLAIRRQKKYGKTMLTFYTIET